MILPDLQEKELKRKFFDGKKQWMVERNWKIFDKFMVVNITEVELVFPEEWEVLACDSSICTNVQMIQVNIKVTLHCIINKKPSFQSKIISLLSESKFIDSSILDLKNIVKTWGK